MGIGLIYEHFFFLKGIELVSPQKDEIDFHPNKL